MKRRFVCGLLALIFFGLAEQPRASAQPDELPSVVRPEIDYNIVKYGVAAVQNCELSLGGIPVGQCDGGGPLRGQFKVRPEHPGGPQKLRCQGCYWISEETSPQAVPGPPQMPGLIGKTPGEAQTILRSLGWNGPLKEQTSEKIWCGTPFGNPPLQGSIVSQDPKRDEPLNPKQGVVVALCKPVPGFRRQSVAMGIDLATITVRPTSVTDSPSASTTDPVATSTSGSDPGKTTTLSAAVPTADHRAGSTSAGLDPRSWIVLLIFGVLILGAVVGLLVLRRPASARPLTESPSPVAWPPTLPPGMGRTASDRPGNDRSTIDGVTLVPHTSVHRFKVRPATGPGRAHAVRLEINPDPGVRIVREGPRGPR